MPQLEAMERGAEASRAFSVSARVAHRAACKSQPGRVDRSSNCSVRKRLTAYVALVLGFQRIVADTLDVKIPSGAFDCEIAKPLPCRDEGVALLGSHYPLLTLLLKA